MGRVGSDRATGQNGFGSIWVTDQTVHFTKRFQCVTGQTGLSGSGWVNPFFFPFKNLYFTIFLKNLFFINN